MRIDFFGLHAPLGLRTNFLKMDSNYGNKQKHESKNPIQQFLLNRFKSQVYRLVNQADPQSVLEVGCGEGYMLDVLARRGVRASLTGVDISETAIEDARKRLGSRVILEQKDARDLADDKRKFDVVMMLEVLEHIPQPELILPVLDQLTTRYVVLSVPWEPMFRGLNFLRGKYVDDWGNHPEHINHWGRREFIRLVQRRFELIEAPMVAPWTLVFAQKRTE